MTLEAVLLVPELMHLAGHVGRIHQCQLQARRGCNVAVLNVRQIGVGWRRLGYGDVNAPMAGGPAAIDQVLLK